MKSIFWSFVASFCALFMLSFEFEYSVFPDMYVWVQSFFERLVSFTGEIFFGLDSGFDSAISSDSFGLLIHLFNIFCISIVLSVIFSIFFKKHSVNLRASVLKILTFYLSLQLLIYGFDKLFKAQFFYPEPNILHTNLKDLSPDILYWSTLGLSRGYSMFLGGAELVAACFLWFYKTRLTGLILGLGIMINVVAVNLGFDISVKVYSLFLLGCFVLVLSPYFSYLYSVLTLNSFHNIPNLAVPKLGVISGYSRGIKSGVIIMILIEGLFPYVVSGNWNDDAVKRPKFHGAYRVESNQYGIEKLYIHRAGYFIVENKIGEKEDFQMELDSTNREIVLWDYRNKKEQRWKYKTEENELNELYIGMDSSVKLSCFLIKE